MVRNPAERRGSGQREEHTDPEGRPIPIDGHGAVIALADDPHGAETDALPGVPFAGQDAALALLHEAVKAVLYQDGQQLLFGLGPPLNKPIFRDGQAAVECVVQRIPEEDAQVRVGNAAAANGAEVLEPDLIGFTLLGIVVENAVGGAVSG